MQSIKENEIKLPGKILEMKYLWLCQQKIGTQEKINKWNTTMKTMKNQVQWENKNRSSTNFMITYIP
jgi:hypothetical protein